MLRVAAHLFIRGGKGPGKGMAGGSVRVVIQRLVTRVNTTRC